MTIIDYIIRAYAKGHLSRLPHVYTTIATRLKNGEIINPAPEDTEMLRELADAGIIMHTSTPRYLSTDPHAEPASHDSTFFVPTTLTLRMPYDSPHCPACDDALALRLENERLLEKLAELKEDLYDATRRVLAS